MTTIDRAIVWLRSFKCDHCKKRHMVEGIREDLDKLEQERTEKCKNE